MTSTIHRERDYYFDNVKFFLITLVVVGHFIDSSAIVHPLAKSMYVFIASFHMPLFIFISGLFNHYQEQTAAQVRNKVIFYTACGFISKLLIASTRLTLTGNAQFSLFSDADLPWFMFALAAYTGLSHVLRNTNCLFTLSISALLGTFVGYDTSIGDYLYLSRIVVFFPFYWVGCALTSTRLRKKIDRNAIRVVGCVLLLAFAVFCLFRLNEIYPYRGLFTGRNSFSAVSAALPGCSWLNRIIAYATTTLVSFGVLSTTPRRKIPLISSAGSRTLQVYMLHVPIVNACASFGLLKSISDLPYQWWLLTVPLAIGATAILANPVLERPFLAVRQLTRNSHALGSKPNEE